MGRKKKKKTAVRGRRPKCKEKKIEKEIAYCAVMIYYKKIYTKRCSVTIYKLKMDGLIRPDHSSIF